MRLRKSVTLYDPRLPQSPLAVKHGSVKIDRLPRRGLRSNKIFVIPVGLKVDRLASPTETVIRALAAG